MHSICGTKCLHQVLSSRCSDVTIRASLVVMVNRRFRQHSAPPLSQRETFTAISTPTRCQQHPKERQSPPVYRPRRGRVPSSVSDNTTHNTYRQWKPSSHSRACLLCLFRFSCCTQRFIGYRCDDVPPWYGGWGEGGVGTGVCGGIINTRCCMSGVYIELTV